MKIKICGMTDAANMLSIAALEPDYFGFIFYEKSPRGIAPEKMRFLPRFEKIERIGVFVNETAEKATAAENILQIAKQADLSFVQLHGAETPAFCRQIRRGDLKIIKTFAVDENFHDGALKDYETVCDYFLFDTKTKAHGGSGKQFDWKLLQKMRINKPFFLGGGIGADNVAEAIWTCRNLPLFALDINSRAEVSAGVKSSEIVKEIMKSANAE
jgi:phosphoribosylanthranilate isomerase